MKRMIGSWSTRCCRTSFSIRKASRTITRAVSRIASSEGTVQPKWCSCVPKTALMRWAKGTWPCWMPTSVSAAKRAMTPCAKLKTPDALKISTKPNATRAYMTPVISPFSVTSAAK